MHNKFEAPKQYSNFRVNGKIGKNVTLGHSWALKLFLKQDYKLKKKSTHSVSKCTHSNFRQPDCKNGGGNID